MHPQKISQLTRNWQEYLSKKMLLPCRVYIILTFNIAFHLKDLCNVQLRNSYSNVSMCLKLYIQKNIQLCECLPALRQSNGDLVELHYTAGGIVELFWNNFLFKILRCVSSTITIILQWWDRALGISSSWIHHQTDCWMLHEWRNVNTGCDCQLCAK